MSIETLVIVGGGGHAKVVLDALHVLEWDVAEVLVIDDDPARQGGVIMGFRILAPGPASLVEGRGFHAAIGDNTGRARAARRCRDAGLRAVDVIHPAAVVASSARVDGGSFVAAGAVVGPDAGVGADCIINHNAVVDHDCRLGAACHVAPGASLGGGVILGTGVLVGAGATILPGRRVGDHCTIGAGAVVTKDVPSNTTVAGVPAIPLARISR